MSFEYLINKLLRIDPELETYLARLANSNLQLCCYDFPERAIYLKFSADYVEVTRIAPGQVDLKISAPLEGLINLAIYKKDADLRVNKISIHGDLHLAEAVQDFFSHVDLDWEELLSQYTGDIFANRAIELFKKFTQYSQNSKQSLEQMLIEYLQEEIKVLPNPHEINDFIQQVDALKLDLDRVEARLNLQAHINESH